MNDPIFFTPEQAAPPAVPPPLAPVRTAPASPALPPPPPTLPAPTAAPVAAHTPAPPAPAPTPAHTAPVGAMQQLDDFLRWAVEVDASDVRLAAGQPPAASVHGEWGPIPGTRPTSAGQLTDMLMPIMTDKQRDIFNQSHDVDLSYALGTLARFRVNVHRQQGEIGTVMRLIPVRVKTVDELGVVDPLRKLVYKPRGLVAVCGPTGSGKTTLLGSLIDLANKERKAHIVTIEEPLEFVHTPVNSIITHREVGTDTATFETGLRAAMREAPNIVLVGEVRDYETASIALRAAETGHLVFTTMHTQSAPETVTRIVDMFPSEQQNNVRAQLAATLEAVVVQTLLKRADGRGRIPAQEIMTFPTSVRALVRAGRLEQLHGELQTGTKHGMQSLNAHLARLVRGGQITKSVAEAAASDQFELDQAIRSAA